jgi:hypothetical protein
MLKAAFEANGKSQVYTVDDVGMVIQLTKTKTHFLTPKDKGPRTPKEPKTAKAPKEPKMAKAPKESKAPKELKTTKEDAKAAFQAALAASKLAAITPVIVPVLAPKVTPVEVTATVTAAASLLDTEKAYAKPVVEIDPLEAALADLSK